MASKWLSVNRAWPTWRGLSLALGMAAAFDARAGQPEPPAVPHFLGATSCSSSGCHGGASEKLNQNLVWSTRDFHSFRPYATLTTARSKQIADAAKLGDATQAAQCTVCHAPLENVPPTQRGTQFSAREAISCESCHGPAEEWFRFHTRPDISHGDRVQA
ncbi:MAG: hypothetical protein HY301_13655, partial [Verrucomicrobia bacterium]|nr:hypothetical protein [Verrucomicrobiota bacterium]